MIKLEEGKYYRTRGGDKAKCIAVSTQDHGEEYGALVISDDYAYPRPYTVEGRYVANKVEHFDDIIAEWKEKRTVKMAPALYKLTSGALCISGLIFESEDDARQRCVDFIKWLIGTPYEIEVEVEE